MTLATGKNIYNESFARLQAQFDRRLQEIRKTENIRRVLIMYSCTFMADLKDKTTAIGAFFADEKRPKALAEPYLQPRRLRHGLKGGRVSMFVNQVVTPLDSDYVTFM